MSSLVERLENLGNEITAKLQGLGDSVTESLNGSFDELGVTINSQLDSLIGNNVTLGAISKQGVNNSLSNIESGRRVIDLKKD